MDTGKKPASPGVYMVMAIAAIVALILVWSLGEVVVEWIAGPAEPAAIVPPTE
ncbi:lipopolysaccharide export LptBFGC system permease protein LptF [Limimaricola variabilis]|uniref:Lipopolysaccharide export LptBFGC system permease protein LptF n=1 Tax=Limimaricola variabilis TaxID=1492771 RepID=A0ABR6HRW1_9RHOB|nr:lipopolysaccharide export LptBFGC system permease protein LptF [Limimaricola variabilis]